MVIDFPAERRPIITLTGRYDKKGNMICTGDQVLYWDSNHDEEDGMGVVTWDTEEEAYYVWFPGVGIPLEYMNSAGIEIVQSKK